MRTLSVLALTGCGPVVAPDVAGDAAFVVWPAPELVLVGSWAGLHAIDPDTGDDVVLTTAPVLTAALGADGRVRWAETYDVSPDDDLDVPCIANCPVSVVGALPDGTDTREELEGVTAGGIDTVVPSADGALLAFAAQGSLHLLDVTTGDRVDGGPGPAWPMSVSDVDGSVVHLEASVPLDEPWQHFSKWTPGHDVVPVRIDDDPNLVWTWRWRGGDHHALLLDRAPDGGTEVALASAATGARSWTARLDHGVWVGTIGWTRDGEALSFFSDGTPPRLTVIDTVDGTVDELGGHAIGDSVWAGASAVSPDRARVAYEGRGDLRIIAR